MKQPADEAPPIPTDLTTANVLTKIRESPAEALNFLQSCIASVVVQPEWLTIPKSELLQILTLDGLHIAVGTIGLVDWA